MSQSHSKPPGARAAKRGATGGSPRIRQILDERERRLAAPEHPDLPSERDDIVSVLLCSMGGNLYGIPMDEVAGLRPLERLSRTGIASAAAVMGLVAENGRVRQVLDLGVLLGGPDPRGSGGYLVMLNSRRDLTLRLAERPHVADVRPDPDDPPRARVASAGEDHDKTLIILSVSALLASDAPVGA